MTKKLTTLLISLVVVIAIGFIGYMAYSFIVNGQKTVYLTYGDKKISNKAELTLEKNVYSTFFVKNALAVSSDSAYINDFQAKICFNKEFEKELESFTYTVDGETVTGISPDVDYTSAFELYVEDSMIMLKLPEELTFQSVLQSIYGLDKTVVVSEDKSVYDGYYFGLMVYYPTEDETLTVYFK